MKARQLISLFSARSTLYCLAATDKTTFSFCSRTGIFGTNLPKAAFSPPGADANWIHAEQVSPTQTVWLIHNLFQEKHWSRRQMSKLIDEWQLSEFGDGRESVRNEFLHRIQSNNFSQQGITWLVHRCYTLNPFEIIFKNPSKRKAVAHVQYIPVVGILGDLVISSRFCL